MFLMTFFQYPQERSNSFQKGVRKALVLDLVLLGNQQVRPRPDLAVNAVAPMLLEKIERGATLVLGQVGPSFPVQVS